jgi:integrase
VKAKPSQRTIEWELNAFKQFLRWAEEQGDYSGNALHFKFSVDKKHSRSAFTADQVHRLVLFTRDKTWLNGVGKHGHDARLTRYREMLRTYVVFMAGTGPRPGEARQLRWKDVTSVELKDGQQAIEVFVHASHSKVKKTRTTIGLDIAAMALDHLRGLREKASDFIAPDDYIWCDTDGTVIKDFREGFNTMIKAAGVETDSMGNKLAIYSLRHLYITSRIRNGVDLYELAKNAGTSPEMIRTFYDHVPTPDMKDELAKYSKW